MRKALFCHQARASALGFEPTVMSYCPVMVAPTSTSVTEERGTITVTLAARGDQDVALVAARAHDLVRPGYRGPHH